jgi:hypothetical protein
MKRVFLPTIAAVAFVLTGTAGPAQAAAQIDRFTSKGQQVYADFYSETGCIGTYASAVAADGRTQWDGHASVESFGYVSVVQYDICTSPVTKLYYNSGYTALNRDAFQMTKSKATLDTSLVLDQNGELPVTVHISWSGDGTLSTATNRTVTRTPDSTSVYRFTGTYQTASAVGTITANADGTNFIPDPSIYAQLMSDGSSMLDVSRE